VAQLYFYYSAMNAGKSTALLQSAYNYEERNMVPVLLTALLDNRFGEGKIASRLGISKPAHTFSADTDIVALVHELQTQQAVDALFVDEAQFLSKRQVMQLIHIVDDLDIPVLAYGIRTDFLGETFSGSQYLLAWADKLTELKTICHCGRKANFVVRLDENGHAIRGGEQVEVGGNERYESMCRKHFKALVWGNLDV
jgi:thymidine kinase